MSKRLVKQVIWLVLVVLVAVIMWLLLNSLAGLLAYFQRGADPASALNIVPNVPPDLNVSLTWLPDDADTGRKVEPFTRTQIESAYLRAWLQWNISYGKNEPYGLKTYFTGPALDAISTSVSDTAAKGWRIEQADTVHNLQLHFYSADGSILSFSDKAAQVGQVVKDKAGKILFAGETTSNYDVVMFLEDGNWRVRHWLKVPPSAADLGPASAAQLQTPAGFVGYQEKALVVDGQPFYIAGVNYYSQATPWDKFWTSYNRSVIDRDFKLIQGLGLNTIRIFVPFEQFGGSKVDLTMLNKLDDLLGRAKNFQLKVIITLFDFRTDYSLLLWPNADHHLETLLTHYKDDPAILAWDLKNEPDLDYKAHGREVVNSWLTHVARLAHRYDPNHLTTIGWSTPQAASALASEVDFVSFHYFTPAAQLSEQYQALQTATGGKPVVLTEFGLPTWNSFFFPNGHTEPEQAEYYSDILAFLRSVNSPGYLAWTLYDFNNVPSNVAGSFPWQTGPQKQLGILRANSSPKPAAALLSPGSSLEVTRVAGWTRFLKPFWLTVFTVIVIIPITGRFVWRHRKFIRRVLRKVRAILVKRKFIKRLLGKLGVLGAGWKFTKRILDKFITLVNMLKADVAIKNRPKAGKKNSKE